MSGGLRHRVGGMGGSLFYVCLSSISVSLSLSLCLSLSLSLSLSLWSYLITRKGDDSEAAVLIRFVELLKLRVLLQGQASFAGHVNNQHDLALQRGRDTRCSGGG